MKKFSLIMALALAALTFASSSSVAAGGKSLRATTVQSAPVVKIVLPERFRLLTKQKFDFRIEATNLTSTNAIVKIVFRGQDVTNAIGTPEVSTNNDGNPADIDKAWTFRGVFIEQVGLPTVEVTVTDGARVGTATTRIGVQPFSLPENKNIILFIGDAMGTAYRDAGRIVAKSTNNRFREGFFDDLQQMDVMPVTGMVMTYALDHVTPDSANTATAWACGNKTIDGALNAFPDNNDFKFDRTSTTTQQATKMFALDNPRVETFWEYLKRLYGYRTGIVTTADVTDATPAGEGGHTISRTLGNDIARQFVDGVFTSGPTFDVIMGGGKERFDARTAADSGDTRNLAAELQAAGYTYVQNRTQLNALPGIGAAGASKVLGLFRTGNMNVAYDKLGLTRPSDEPPPSFGGFTDQPFLDEMTAKAVATLNRGGSPFILMVEGASVDKQSHPNNAAGQIWDTIELDKSVGVARTYLNSSAASKASTLVLVTADHDQSMSIIGAVDTLAGGAVQNVRSTAAYPNPGSLPGESAGFPDYQDANGDGYPENTNRLRIMVGYRTGNHAGSSVPLTAEGAGALLFIGYYDQTEIFFKMARVLSLHTAALDQALAEKTRAEDEIRAFSLMSEKEGRRLRKAADTRPPLASPRAVSAGDDDEPEQ
ncbi:MAG: alkaline phosphatase [Pyrinomonadaceae bacterium]